MIYINKERNKEVQGCTARRLREVCPCAFSLKSEGGNNMDAITNLINQIDAWVWGWWMILLLLGTHIFMTIRTGVIQRKIGTAIKLSVTKDPDGEGEVSQFGALTTALALRSEPETIIGVGTGNSPRWSRSSSVVLALPVCLVCDKIQRITDRS